MLSERQQRNVWEAWLASEIRANYFADLGSSYHQQQQRITLFILVCSSGAFVTLTTDWLPPSLALLRPALAFLTATLSLWLLVEQHQRKVTECADLHFQWLTLSNAYEKLWDNMYATDASRALETLDVEQAELSKRAAALLPNDQKRMKKWQDHVERHHAVHAAA